MDKRLKLAKKYFRYPVSPLKKHIHVCTGDLCKLGDGSHSEWEHNSTRCKANRVKICFKCMAQYNKGR